MYFNIYVIEMMDSSSGSIEQAHTIEVAAIIALNLEVWV